MLKIYLLKDNDKTLKCVNRLFTMLTIPYQLLPRDPISFYIQDWVNFRKIADQVEEDFRHGGGDATWDTMVIAPIYRHLPPPGRRKSAPSFFFYIRERGKKNHRFSLRSTRRQLYESLPWSLDLRHISSDVLHDPSPCLTLSSSTRSLSSLPSAPRLAVREEDIIYFVN